MNNYSHQVMIIGIIFGKGSNGTRIRTEVNKFEYL